MSDAPHELLRGTGEMAGRIRAFDWASTPLGPLERWPAELMAVVNLLLASPLVSTIALTADRLLIYNDTAAQLYGTRHPGALGRPLGETFPDSYPSVAPLYDRVFAGESVQVLAQPLAVGTNAGDEVFDAYLTPIWGSDGAVAGAHMVGLEMGGRIRAEAALRESDERQAFLLKLSDALRPLVAGEAIQSETTRLLGEHLGLDRCYYFETDLETGEYVIFRDFTRGNLRSLVGRHPMQQWPETTAALRRGDMLVVHGYARSPEIPPEEWPPTENLDIRAIILVPLVKQGSLVACMAAIQAVPRDWKAGEVSLVADVAERTWAAVERARAETALRESEEKYRSLFTTMGQGHIEVELVRDASGHVIDYRYLQLNPAYERLTGIPVEKALGRPSLEVIPSLSSFWARKLERIAQNRQPEHFEYEEKALGRWFGIYAYPGFGDRLTVLALDITERKGAEAALRQSEEKFRTLFESIDEGFAIVEAVKDDQGRVTDLVYREANRTYARHAGFQPHPGQCMKEIAPGIEEDWIDYYDRVCSTGVAETKESYNADFHRWYRTHCSRIGPKGSPLLGFVFEDITGRKRAEEMLRASEERQTFLLALSDALRNQPSGATMIETASRRLGEWLDASSIMFSEFDEERDSADIFFGWFADGAKAFPTVMRLGENSDPIVDDLRTGKTVRIDDTGTPFQWSDLDTVAETEVKALLSVSAVVGDRSVVNLTVHQHAARNWTDDDAALVKEVLGRLWVDLKRMRAEAALRESGEWQTSLLELNDALNLLTDPIEIQKTAMKVVAEQLRLSRAFYFRVERDDDGWSHVIDSEYIRVGGLPSMVGRHSLKHFGAQFFQDLAHGIVLQVPDVATMPGVTPAELASYEAVGVAAFVNLPLRRKGEYSAGITAHDVVPRVWTSAEIDLLRDVGNRTWAAVERACAEAARNESEERFRLFVENVREYALVQTDFEGHVTSWNPGAERLFYYTSAEIVGKSFVLLLPEKDRHEGIIAREMAVLSRGEKSSDVHTVQRKDGSQFWAEWITEPVLDDAGNLRGTAKVMRDETDRQRAQQLLEESEHRLRAVLEGIPQLVWRAAAEGEWTWSSSQWMTFTGQSEEESLGEGWLEAIHPEDRERTKDAWLRARPKRLFDVEHRIRRAVDGHYVWHHTRSLPYRDLSAKTVEWFGTSTDIAVSKKASAEKEALLKEVHHRVKNNLQVITSLVNLQSQQISDRSTRAQFDETRNRVLSIASIHELLYQSDSFAEIDLARYARQLTADLLAFYGVQDRVRVEVLGDGITIELERAVPYGLVVNELVSNTLKHAFPQGRTGLVQVEVSTAGEQIHLIVKDNGVGISPSVDPKRSSSLGIRLIEALSTQLGGSIRYLSGCGTVAELYFPATPEEA